MYPIERTHAFIITAIEEIHPGEEITIKYTESGYYYGGGSCRCQACTGVSPTDFKRLRPEESVGAITSGTQAERRKTRRGGVRARRRSKKDTTRRDAQSAMEVHNSAEEDSADDIP